MSIRSFDRSPLVTAADLVAALATPTREEVPIVLDASFELTDPGAGRRAFLAGHIPGARFADLDTDLCGSRTGTNGRHPLPQREAFACTVAAWGVTPGREVVVYDRQGAMFAAHLWWMLRWLGHEQVRVLDGGWAAWQQAGGTVQAGEAAAPQGDGAGVYPTGETEVAVRDSAAVLRGLAPAAGGALLVDARAPERYRGEIEPLDPVAGHIPGARNRFFQLNLGADGRFRPAAELRDAFELLLGGRAPAEVVHQCGSGVTACHNLLAMEVAGLPGSALYPGSWSEWCADPSRPVASGPG